ncbi:MAG: hypothetical protein PVF58_18320 [Candidatus Methanofastidiosia archaeon]|jgi:beta propeller repeat protein
MTKKLSRSILLGILILLVIIHGLQDSHEIQITTHVADQLQPAVYKNIIVWTDERNGNKDIYGYNLETKEEFQITNTNIPEFTPDIYEDMVVYVEAETQDISHISVCHLSTGEITRLTTGDTIRENPVIYNTLVLWEEANYHARNICGYDFSTDHYRTFTHDKNFQINPAIGGGIAVWEGHHGTRGDIYGMNLETYHKYQIGDEYLSDNTLAVWDTIVVWEQLGKICWIYIPTGKKACIESQSDKQCPAIHGKTIVYEDYRHRNADIYGYHVEKQKEFCIIGNDLSQKEPDIHENLVVWQDERNGNKDIYCCYLPIRMLSIGHMVIIAGLIGVLIVILIKTE